MSAAPKLDYQQESHPQVETQPALAVLDPGQQPGGANAPSPYAKDDWYLGGMLVGCGLFAVALAAYVVIPYMQLWSNS